MKNKQKILKLLLLIMMVMLPSSVEAAVTFDHTFGSQGSGAGQFSGPSDVAIDSNGDIYVTDYFNLRIQEFSIEGTYLRSFGEGILNYPNGLTIDSNDNIIVADYYNHRVVTFDPSGTLIESKTITGFRYPADVAVDSDGNLFVTDSNNYEVDKFDSNYNYLLSFGSRGSGDGQFASPDGDYRIAIDDQDNVYVGDPSNHRIQKFSNSGTFITSFGSYGTGDGQFSRAWGCDIDADGNLYVLDLNNNRVQILNSDGNFLEKFGTSGSGDGEFSGPYGIVLGKNNEIIVADFYNSRIQVFSAFESILPPTVTTGAATNITQSSATLNGTVNANGLSTSAWFEYGTTSGSYTDTTSTQSISGSSATSIGASISGLSASTTYYYRIVAQNSTGTSNGSEVSFTTSAITDNTSPSGSISINSGDNYTNSIAVALSLSATDSVGVTGYYLSTSSTKPTASASGWTSVTSTTSYSASVSYTLSSGDGGKAVYVWYKDAAGNVSSTYSDSITLDTTSPTVTITSPTSSSTYTSENSTISLGGSASDSTSGVKSVTWTNSATGASGTASGTTSWSISNINLSNGDNAITVTATDNAGNSATDTITVTYGDTTAPSGSISINSGNNYTASRSVTLSLSATDSVGVTGYYLSTSSTKPSSSASGWTSVTSTTSYSASVSYTLSSGDGSKTVYIWYKDAAGNVSSTYSDSITLDTTSPTVTITSPTSNSTYTSDSSTISLSGSASDSTSGIQSVTWSNSTNGGGTASGTTNWTISTINLSVGDNVITVSATDNAGNTGTDTITVTYSAKGAPIVTTGLADYVTSHSAMLSGTVNPNNLTTTVWFEYKMANGSWDTTSAQTVTGSSETTVDVDTLVNGLSADTIYYYRIAAVNSAGTAYGSENSFITPELMDIAAGGQHSLALKSEGTVWAWGYNGNGQLGDGTTTSRDAPVQVSGLSGVVAIAGGQNHSLAVKSDGTVWAWGYNGNGQLGDGTTTSRDAPVQVSGLSGVVAIAGGGSHSLALKTDGTVWAWGLNSSGQLGDGTITNRSAPVQVSGLSDMVAIAGGQNHSLAVKSDGTAWAWGHNGSGQLGDGTTTSKRAPVQVSGLSDVVAIAGGGHHSLVLKSNGTAWAWGYNYHGQLGDGTNYGGTTPVQVSGLSDIVAVAGGQNHSLAVKSDGTAWAWGYNWYGQLGDGTYTDRDAPVQVSGLSDMVAIAGGESHSLALKSDGTVWSWGNNTDGKLGDGTTTDRYTQHLNPASCVFGCSDGTTTDRYTPVQVSDLDLDEIIIPTPSPTPPIIPTPSPTPFPSPTHFPEGDIFDPPLVKTEAATNVTSNTATLNGTIVESFGFSVEAWFEYSKDGSDFLTEPASEYIGNRVSTTISNLSPGTTYYYRVVAEYTDLPDNVYLHTDEPGYGSFVSFTTLSDTTPIPTPTSTPALIEAEVNIESQVINLNNKGKFNVYIDLPSPYDVGDIVCDTVECEGAQVTDCKEEDDKLKVRFNIQDLDLGENETQTVVFTVTGELVDGTKFEGSDTVKVKGGKTDTTPTPTPSPGEGYAIIFGAVEDEYGSPFQGVEVTLEGEGYTEKTETDEDGDYVFFDLVAGDYTLTFEADDYVTQTVTVSIEVGEVYEVDTVQMETEEFGMIYGFVYDIDGDPIEEAKVRLKGIDVDLKEKVYTDGDGYFEFDELEAGTYKLVVKKKRYKKYKETITLREGQEKYVEAELHKSSRSRGDIEVLPEPDMSSAGL